MSGSILVTGAAGFAGSHLVELLARNHHNLTGWHRPGGAPPSAISSITWQPVDLLDRAAVYDAIRQTRPVCVYHCAGAAHVGRAWDATASTLAVNVLGTHHLIGALEENGVDARVMIPSSAMIYKPSEKSLSEDDPLVPPNPYGLSKLAQELLGSQIASARVKVTIGRAFNHIGPRQDPSFAASSFARQIADIEAGRHEPEIVVGNLDARREVMDVRDTVRAYEAILERGQSGRPYNVSSGQAIAIGELLDLLLSRARGSISVRVDPARYRPNDLPLLEGNPQRIRDELGWTPLVPLSQTLDDLLAYWRSR